MSQRLDKQKNLFFYMLGPKLTHTVRQNSPAQQQRMAADLLPVSYLADHGSFGPQSCSLHTLVGPFTSEANEELVTMDGFPSFG